MKLNESQIQTLKEKLTSLLVSQIMSLKELDLKSARKQALDAAERLKQAELNDIRKKKTQTSANL